MQYYTNPLDELKGFFLRKSMLKRLIIINVIVFFIVNIFSLIFYLFQFNSNNSHGDSINLLIYWLAVPADVLSLLLKPWTLFTYMFLHENLLHLLFNMLVLYFAGRIFMEYLDDKKLLSLYLFGGFCGAAFYILSYNVFPVFRDSISNSIALGASASVLAVLVAIAVYIPEYTVHLLLIGKVKLKYIAITLVIMDVFSIQRGNAGGHLAHLGGALWGYSYIAFFLKSNVLKKYDISSWFNKLFKKINFEKKSKLKKVYSRERPVSDEEYNREKIERQKKIDKILDKISRSGYSSLTTEEKDFLFRTSNNKNR